MTKLHPFWRYYGGKWRAAPRYPAPRYDTIIEPFAGAAGYSMRYPERRVVLVERYAVIAEMWRWLISATPADVLAIPCVDHIDELPGWVPAGARSLVGFCMNNGTTSPRKQTSSGLLHKRAMGRRTEGWTEARRASVAAQVGAIKHWRVVEGDYRDAPGIEATWFVDPPYNNKAGANYKYHDIDYPALGAWCQERRGQVIACENDGATWLPFRPFAAQRNAMSGRTSTEAIWTNDDALIAAPTTEEPPMPKHEFMWLDLETTGLDPHAPGARVLEFAAVLCEDARGDDFAIVDSYSGAIHVDDADLHAAAIDARVWRMHTANGLWTDVAASTTTSEEVDAFLAGIATELCGGRKHAITLAGSSVHFDLAWCRHFPTFAEYLSHRVFDVTTLRRAVESWAPPGTGAAGWEWPRRDVHRALADITATIEEARICRRAMRFGGA